MENEQYPYQKQWEEYQRRRNTIFYIFISPILAALLIALLNSVGIKFDKNAGVEFFLAVVWGIAYLISVMSLYRFRCPKCGQGFFALFRLESPLLRDKCDNCKLSKYFGSTFYN